jgi:hypothetical protein
MTTIHTTLVKNYLENRSPNAILQQIPPEINNNEETLPRKTRRTLAQLRANESPFLLSYMNKISSQTHSSPYCPLCNGNIIHDTKHLFTCTSINTNLNPIDLWHNPLAVALLLQEWEDALGAAGGGGRRQTP